MRFFQSRHRQFTGSRAGGDHGPIEDQGFAIHLNRRWPDEFSLTDKDIDAETGEALDRIMAADAGAKPAHPFHRGAEGSLRLTVQAHPERRTAAGFMNRARRANDPFGRDATYVEAVAAHEIALDQRDLGAEPGGAGGTD
jgi:hypothetical protein